MLFSDAAVLSTNSSVFQLPFSLSLHIVLWHVWSWSLSDLAGRCPVHVVFNRISLCAICTNCQVVYPCHSFTFRILMKRWLMVATVLVSGGIPCGGHHSVVIPHCCVSLLLDSRNLLVVYVLLTFRATWEKKSFTSWVNQFIPFLHSLFWYLNLSSWRARPIQFVFQGKKTPNRTDWHGLYICIICEMDPDQLFCGLTICCRACRQLDHFISFVVIVAL